MRSFYAVLCVLCVTFASGCASIVQQPEIVEEQAKLVLAAANKPLLTEQLVCPGAGAAECEFNWQSVSIGDGEVKVGHWLSGGQSQTEVFIDRVITHRTFGNGGTLTFRNGVLIELSRPQSYGFPAAKRVS